MYILLCVVLCETAKKNMHHQLRGRRMNDVRRNKRLADNNYNTIPVQLWFKDNGMAHAQDHIIRSPVIIIIGLILIAAISVGLIGGFSSLFYSMYWDVKLGRSYVNITSSSLPERDLFWVLRAMFNPTVFATVVTSLVTLFMLYLGLLGYRKWYNPK